MKGVTLQRIGRVEMKKTDVVLQRTADVPETGHSLGHPFLPSVPWV